MIFFKNNEAKIIALTYLALIAGAEAIGVFIAPVPGMIAHVVLLPVLLSHYVLAEQKSYRRLFVALALLPLLRILSWTMPVKQLPGLYWYTLVGLPLLTAVILTTRFPDISPATMNVHASPWQQQIGVILSGAGLSLAAFLIARPQPLINLNAVEMAAGEIILILLTGLTEELIFRGLLLNAVEEIFGSGSILYSSALFAIMYVGSLSLGYVLLMGAVGLFFGWWVRRTGSIWGAALAHGLLNIGLLLVWPFILGL